MHDIAIIITAIGSSSVLSTVVTFYFTKRKLRVETDSVLIRHIFEWADKMRDEIRDLRAKVEELTLENQKLHEEVMQLRMDVRHER